MNIKPILTALAVSSSTLSAQVIYTEDFDNMTLPPNTQATFGFWNNNSTFDQIVASASTSILNDAIAVTSTGAFRGIGIAIDPNTLQGAGTYTFSFDVISFSDSNNSVNTNTNSTIELSVWEGSGYDLANNADYIRLNAQSNILTADGSAVASQVTNSSFTNSTIGTTQSVTFTSDGTSALIIYLGAETTNFPHPTVTFDNLILEVGDTTMIPEPSSSLLIGLGFTLLVFRRRRS